MAASYLKRDGKYNREMLAATAGGAANAGAIPALDTNGRLTADMLPAGYGPDANTLVASEALKAGDFVNIYRDGSGAAKVRKAVATGAGFEARGYVTADVAANGTATVLFDDANAAVTSAPVGVPLFLSDTVPGGFTDTPPTGKDKLSQCLGIAVSATIIHVSLETTPTILAQ